jgi:hypothetical protein
VDQNPRFALLLKRLAESDDTILDRHYRLAGIKDLQSPVLGDDRSGRTMRPDKPRQKSGVRVS